MANIATSVRNFQHQQIGSPNLEPAPDECPRCHVHVRPLVLGAWGVLGAGEVPGTGYPRRVDAAFVCTNNECGHVFLGEFQFVNPSLYILQGAFVPVTAVPPPIQEQIGELSPDFVAIYGQAFAAEAAQLNEIVGCGLRKALEFLIKDFAISEASTEEDKSNIRKQDLSVVINNYVKDGNVQECAKRAAWLGNDETHYVRKWTEHDIRDLKTLIHLSMNFIDSLFTMRRYQRDMDNPRR